MTNTTTTTTKATPIRNVKATAKKASRITASAKAKLARSKAAARRAEKTPSLSALSLTIKANNLHVYRGDAVKGAMAGQNSSRLYAAALLVAFGDGFWKIMVQKGPLSDNEEGLRKNAKAEKRACRAHAESRGLADPNRPWNDAKKHLTTPEEKAASNRGRKAKPAIERVKTAIMAAFKIAHTNYDDTTQDDPLYIAVYDALTALCKVQRIDIKAIIDKA